MAKTLETVLRKTYASVEIIAVDDTSRPG